MLEATPAPADDPHRARRRGGATARVGALMLLTAAGVLLWALGLSERLSGRSDHFGLVRGEEVGLFEVDIDARGHPADLQPGRSSGAGRRSPRHPQCLARGVKIEVRDAYP